MKETNDAHEVFVKNALKEKRLLQERLDRRDISIDKRQAMIDSKNLHLASLKKQLVSVNEC